MFAALIDGQAGVVGALLAALAVAIPSWLTQRRVHRDNREDHASTAAVVAQIAVDMTEVKSDVRDVKADVRDLKAADRMLTQRLDEHIAEQPPRRTA